jgi:REP element-mobilizing transposase RayT
VIFLDLIRYIKKRDGWTVFAWCLMSNHYHLAIRTSAIPLWRGMHHLQCTYSRGFNRRCGRTGGLWQSRYQARYVDAQRYLSQVILYIHLNPVRAGIVVDAGEHGLSGHGELLKRSSEPLVDGDDALLCFGQTRRAALRAYRAGIDAGVLEDGAKEPAERSGIRHLSWMDRSLEPKAGQEYVDVLGRSTGLEREQLGAGDYVEAMCKLLGTDVEVLASRARTSTVAEARRIIATLGVERWRQRPTELAKALHKNPDSVSWMVGEGVRRRLQDPEYAELLDKLDKGLERQTNRSLRGRGSEG